MLVAPGIPGRDPVQRERLAWTLAVGHVPHGDGGLEALEVALIKIPDAVSTAVATTSYWATLAGKESTSISTRLLIGSHPAS